MRIFEIIGETADTWETRFAAHQRRQTKRGKLRAKLNATKDSAARQRRAAADRQSAANDRINAIRRDLFRT